MPTVQGTDNFNHGDFTVPGGGPYSAINGSPAKDTSIVHSPEPASLLIATTAAEENVQSAISGSPRYGWHGFWFRLESADEPGANTKLAFINAADGFHGNLEFQPSANNFFHYINTGTNFPQGATYTFGTWVWIEMILDTDGAGTRTQYVRIGGVDLTASTLAKAASSASSAGLGSNVATPTIPAYRYSNHYWGSAASISDWMGEPVTGGITKSISVMSAIGF